MGRIRLAIALGIGLSLAAAPSLAADASVHATNASTFSPKTVTIDVGDSVTFTNDGGFHNVHFDDGKFTQPSSPSFSWPTEVKRTFDAAGSYPYHCDQHGAAGGVGMSGTVIVKAPGGGTDTTPPKITSLKVAPSKFCNHHTSSCPKTGARLRFTIDEDAHIDGKIIRRSSGKTVGTLSIEAVEGDMDLKFRGKNLALGKYLVQLTPKDAAGNKASASKAGFKIATSR